MRYNPSVSSVPPTNPHRVASAYSPPIAGRIGADRADAVSRTDRVAISSDAASQAAQRRISRLVAAVVPGGVDFDAPAPVPSPPGAAIPLYQHPAHRHVAATQLHSQLGRNLDVTA